MYKLNRNTLKIATIYFGLISVGLSQPLFNIVEIFQREFQVSLLGLILIVVFFQYGITAFLLLIRLAIGKWGTKLDYVVYFAALISLLRQIQITYLETVTLSHLEKTALAAALVLGAIVIVLLFKRALDQFCSFLGLLSPLFGIFFVYVMIPHVTASNDLAKINIETTAIQPKPPVILIILDELSLPVLLAENGGIDKSKFPNFHAFANDSVWFRQAISNYPGSSVSFPSFLSGRLKLNANDLKFADNVETLPQASLPWILRKNGYRISIMSDFFGCKSEVFMCPRYLSDQNISFVWRVFSKFIQEFGPDYIVDQFLPFLHGGLLKAQYASMLHVAKTAKPNSFYLVHMLTTHAPYIFSRTGDYLYSPDLKMSAGSNYKSAYSNYFEQVLYQDKKIGEVIAGLKKSGLYEKAVIAITADHGNCWSDSCPGRVYPQKIKVVEPTLPRVPMFLKAPGLQPRIDDGDFQLIDLMPTIIDAAGIPTSTVPKIDGRSALKAVGKLRKRSFILKTFGESIDVGLPVRRIIVESK